MVQQTKTRRVEREMNEFFGGENDAPESVSSEASPTTDIMRLESEGDPETMLAILEKKAQLAPRFRAAIDLILASQTYAKDWNEQGEHMCLSSAGAERIGRNFPIQFFEVSGRREDFTDGIGKGYNYIYQCRASMGGHLVFAIGTYGTREDFLGKKSGEWRALEEISENDIRMAAYHKCCGNAIKALLGIRGIPKTDWDVLMANTGRPGATTNKVAYGKGTQGGTAAGDTDLQHELAEICIAIAHAGYTVVSKDFKEFTLEASSDLADPMMCAQSSCVTLSTFIGKDGGPVKGLGAKDLKGMRLQKTTEKARQMKTKMEALCQK